MPLLSPTLVALAMAAALPLAPVPAVPVVSPGPAGPDVVPTPSDGQRRLTIAVHIGAQGPFRFLVDTGAENTVLADDMTGRIGVAPGGRRTVTGVAGALLVDTVSLDDVRIGRHVFSQACVPLLHADAIHADGILGIDALQGQRVLFDFAHDILSIGTGADAQGDDGYDIVVTARRRSGQLIVTQVRIDGIDTDVVIDTGTEISVGNRALERQLVRRSVAQPTRLVSVTGQSIAADLSTTGTLSVGHLRLDNMLIAFADSPAFAALHLDRRPALLLGMRELRAMRRVAIDFGQRRVLFDVTG